MDFSAQECRSAVARAMSRGPIGFSDVLAARINTERELQSLEEHANSNLNVQPLLEYIRRVEASIEGWKATRSFLDTHHRDGEMILEIPDLDAAKLAVDQQLAHARARLETELVRRFRKHASVVDASRKA